jgi:uncharacterized coiled-coil protein SlyX
MRTKDLTALAAGLAPVLREQFAQRDATIATLNAELAEIRRRLTALELQLDAVDLTGQSRDRLDEVH